MQVSSKTKSKKIINILRTVTNLIVHSLAVGLVIYSTLPIIRWYLDYKPLWGVDFHLLTTLSSLFSYHLVPPYAWWNWAWFGGFPNFLYPSLHAYIAYFLDRTFDLIYSVQLLAMIFTFIFLLGAYFLFFILSRNLVLSAILAISVAFSSGVYQALTWAGSIPSFATQAALPWSLFFLVWYFKSHKLRLLLASSLIAGISIWGHPLIFITYIVPATLILVATKFDKGLDLAWKFKTIIIFIFTAAIIGLPVFYNVFENAVGSVVVTNYGKDALSTTTVPTQLEIDIANFNKAQVARIISDNHIAPFILVLIAGTLFIISLLIRRRIKPLVRVLPFILIAAYFAFYIWLFGQGISIYHGGWYRLFWSVPIWVGALAAVLWGEATFAISSFLKSQSLGIIFNLGATFLVALAGITFLTAFPANSTINQIIYRSQVSSAHPDELNLKVSDDDRKQLKERLLPKWIDGNDTNWRLYDADQTVNLWWPQFFKMPLGRGYIEPPIYNFQKRFLFFFLSFLS